MTTNYYDLHGRLIGTSDGGFSTTNVYNMQGLLVSQSKGGVQTGSWVYDIEDRVLQHTDANRVLVTNLYDDLDRLLTRTCPDGGLEQFEYSARGMISYTNQIGKVTRFGYDERGQKTAETNANLEVIQFKYNAAGDLTNLVHGRLKNTYWNYDSQGRMTNKLPLRATCAAGCAPWGPFFLACFSPCNSAVSSSSATCTAACIVGLAFVED